MRETLQRLVDKPVLIRTVPDNLRVEPVKGVVFEVRDDAVDILVGTASMRSVRYAAIIDVALDAVEARRMILEDPPAHVDYARGKRLAFEAEELRNLKQPEEKAKAKAREAEAALRNVQKATPGHLWTHEMLERAHFIATGRSDYEEADPGNASLASGEIPNANFRWARWYFGRLEDGLKQKLSESTIGWLVAQVGRLAGRVVAKYPAHAEAKTWFDRAEAIRKKLDEDVRKNHGINEPFVPGKG